MVYALCYCLEQQEDRFRALGFADSKTLQEAQREGALALLNTAASRQFAGWSIRALSPHEISSSMLRREKYNLNELAHDTTVQLIRDALAQVPLTRVYVDTVGPAEKYQAKLASIFPTIRFTVTSKADSLFPVVSAASICAKVARDQILKHWVFEEKGLCLSRAFGSGYPSDPHTVDWLRQSLSPLFGYPSIIRFSWATCVELLKSHAVNVVWPEPPQPSKAQGSVKRRRGQEVAAKGAAKPDTTLLKGPFFAKRRMHRVARF